MYESITNCLNEASLLYSVMSIKEAIQAINKNKLVAIPTETVYGLAAPVSNINLIKKIFELKKRPFFDPLIVHVSSIEMAKSYSAHWTNIHQNLAQCFWPGPLTIITDKNVKVDKILTAGLDTVGLRLPDHEMTCEFISKLGEGVAAPSANTFTKTSPTTSDHVRKYFKDEDVFILEGGSCTVGIESTIIKVDGKEIVILRPGMISREDILNKFPDLTINYGSEHLKSVPGSHHSHYKPDYKLVITLKKLDGDEILNLEKECGGKTEFIKVDNCAALAARSVYSILHADLRPDFGLKLLDLSHIKNITESENWQAIINRLEKASYKFIK